MEPYKERINITDYFSQLGHKFTAFHFGCMATIEVGVMYDQIVQGNHYITKCSFPKACFHAIKSPKNFSMS